MTATFHNSINKIPAEN